MTPSARTAIRVMWVTSVAPGSPPSVRCASDVTAAAAIRASAQVIERMTKTSKTLCTRPVILGDTVVTCRETYRPAMKNQTTTGPRTAASTTSSTSVRVTAAALVRRPTTVRRTIRPTTKPSRAMATGTATARSSFSSNGIGGPPDAEQPAAWSPPAVLFERRVPTEFYRWTSPG